MSCWALIALKSPVTAKGRLAETLDAASRQRLVEQMFADVMQALRAASLIDGVAVVTTLPAESSANKALLAGSEVWSIADPDQGLNAALAHGVAELAVRGIKEVLILHADLPLVSGAEIDALITAGREHESQLAMVINADKAGQGSNALYLPVSLADRFRFRFGQDSFRQHQLEAAAHGTSLLALNLPGLAFDVDEPQDLQQLLSLTGTRYDFLRHCLPSEPGC